ncbi:hypothetical protein F25303_6008 [Fusarium sp. NRRL 25303]|nr:hypothetical protein F25303_6008 [Fusarium sp. NRRL 25303]
MAAPTIVVSAIQTLGELPPVHIALLAVSAIPLSVLAVYSLLSGENSNSYLTKRGFLHLLVTAEVKAICQGEIATSISLGEPGMALQSLITTESNDYKEFTIPRSGLSPTSTKGSTSRNSAQKRRTVSRSSKSGSRTNKCGIDNDREELKAERKKAQEWYAWWRARHLDKYGAGSARSGYKPLPSTKGK